MKKLFIVALVTMSMMGCAAPDQLISQADTQDSIAQQADTLAEAINQFLIQYPAGSIEDSVFIQNATHLLPPAYQESFLKFLSKGVDARVALATLVEQLPAWADTARSESLKLREQAAHGSTLDNIFQSGLSILTLALGGTTLGGGFLANLFRKQANMHKADSQFMEHKLNSYNSALNEVVNGVDIYRNDNPAAPSITDVMQKATSNTTKRLIDQAKV